MLRAAVLVVLLSGCAAASPSPIVTPVPTPPGVRVITGVDENHYAIFEPLVEVFPSQPTTTQLVVVEEEPVVLGIEGAWLFLRGTMNGTVVVDRNVDWDGDVQALPQGDYVLEVYYEPVTATAPSLTVLRRYARCHWLQPHGIG
jgi:hypothetical protein